MTAIIFLAALAAAPAQAQTLPSSPLPVIVAVPAPDPERLALAREAARAVWPDGTYARLMNGGASDSLMAAFLDMKLSDFAPAGAMGKADPATANLTFREMMQKDDPNFAERMRIINRVVMTELAAVFTKYEPELREGIARAYARKFSAAELVEINRFFATPAGRAYAAEGLTAMMDPEVMTRMMKAIPDLVQVMPRVMEKMKQATAHLPPAHPPAVTGKPAVTVKTAPRTGKRR